MAFELDLTTASRETLMAVITEQRATIGQLHKRSTPTERCFLRRGRHKEVVDEVWATPSTGCW